MFWFEEEEEEEFEEEVEEEEVEPEEEFERWATRFMKVVDDLADIVPERLYRVFRREAYGSLALLRAYFEDMLRAYEELGLPFKPRRRPRG